VPFLRLSRDQRGYETTILLHAAHPGGRPRVLYWYRSAPGVRVGRPALDEDAIRTIEEQHPDIEFDWPHILEVRAAAIVEVERRPERGPRGRGGDAERRKAVRLRDGAPASVSADSETPEPSPEADASGDAATSDAVLNDALDDEVNDQQPGHAPDLLAELVGRDIATRLRARYAEINARIHQMPVDESTRAAWHTRAERLNPDSWLTPDEILHGVSRADELFDALRRELLS
jgi:hypothetical protein